MARTHQENNTRKSAMQNKRRENPGRTAAKGKGSKTGRKDWNGREKDIENMYESKESATHDRTNDPRWYANNPQLLESAASYSFASVLGGKLPYSAVSSVPGVLALRFVPCFGDQAATVAARNVYSYVRHANSGKANYDAPDLMMYIMAVDSAFSYISMLQRIYGVLRLYDQRNRYYPDALLKAMGVNAEDLKANMANFNFHINQLVAKASVLWIPNTMPVVERHYWMNANLYTDGESAKAQTYLFTQVSFYKYDPTLTQQGGGLTPLTWLTGTDKTYADIIKFSESLFAPLDANNEDFGIIGGDILKAYGADKLYKVNEIPFDYTVMPTYSKEVLSQIHNSTASSYGLGKIIQDAEGRIYESTINVDTDPTNLAWLPAQQMFDFFQADNPSPEQVMVATRLKESAPFITSVTVDNKTTWTVTPMARGTERLQAMQLWYVGNDGNLASVIFTSGSVGTFDVGTTRIVLSLYSMFDWAPFLYIRDENDNASVVIGDVENYTTIGFEGLTKLHTTAVWSEFGIPTM